MTLTAVLGKWGKTKIVFVCLFDFYFFIYFGGGGEGGSSFTELIQLVQKSMRLGSNT